MEEGKGGTVALSQDCSLLSVDCAFQLSRDVPTMIIEINFLCKVRIIADVVGRLKLHLRETERETET